MIGHAVYVQAAGTFFRYRKTSIRKGAAPINLAAVRPGMLYHQSADTHGTDGIACVHVHVVGRDQHQKTGAEAYVYRHCRAVSLIGAVLAARVYLGRSHRGVDLLKILVEVLTQKSVLRLPLVERKIGCITCHKNPSFTLLRPAPQCCTFGCN